MTVIARDPVASDHLVYPWPFAVGADCEVACGDDEQVVMCPAWLVGERLGPGRHRWRSPDPARPTVVYFVLTEAIDLGFDMVTSFVVPSTGQPVRVRATGNMQVRCADPALLVAQFVGLPFEGLSAGVLRSASRSVERMLARLLVRRVVMSATPVAVTDAGMLPGIIEELVAYNPAAGSVFGLDLVRIARLVIAADDGSSPSVALPVANLDWSASYFKLPPAERETEPHAAAVGSADIPLLETARGVAPPPVAIPPAAAPGSPAPVEPVASASSPEIARRKSAPPITPEHRDLSSTSGEIVVRGPSDAPTTEGVTPLAIPSQRVGIPERASSPSPAAESSPRHTILGIGVAAIGDGADEAETTTTEQIPAPPVLPATAKSAAPAPKPDLASKAFTDIPTKPLAVVATAKTAPPGAKATPPPVSPPDSSETSAASGGVAPGSRVLVPGADGLMQAATVKQQLQGYYELEVGSSGETMWVPVSGVLPG